MKRILSIDIFRGLTIFLMVFVNDLAGVSNIPAWMKHVAADVDGMTFVDVVFPAFLFIVGMAIPFAVERRQAKTDGWGFWRHILQRTLGLLILGVYMVNSGEMNLEANLLPKQVWSPLLYVAAVLIWNSYPRGEDRKIPQKYRLLQVVGLAILVLLYFTYRKGTLDNLIGMTPSWWGILGLIGWAYFISVCLYLLSRKNKLGLLLVYAVVAVLYLGTRADIPLLANSWLNSQSGHLAHTLIVLSGIFCGLLIPNPSSSGEDQKNLRKMVIWGLLLLIGGYFTRPLGGISKIGSTPSWVFYCAGICALLYPFIYWLVDIKGIKRWANFLKPAGENPLLTYLIPPFFYGLVGFAYLPAMFNTGGLGFLKSIVFSVMILAVANWFTKKGIRLCL